MTFLARAKQLQRVVGLIIGLGIIASTVLGRVVGLDYRAVLVTDKIGLSEGRMYFAPLPAPSFPFIAVADSNSQPQISPLHFYENNRELGPAHTLHMIIRQIGAGTYSDWNGTLLFSTSDNSDPTTNGRVYQFKTRTFLQSWFAIITFSIGVALCWRAAADFSRRAKNLVAQLRRKRSVAVDRIARVVVGPKTAGDAALLYGLILCLPALTLFIAAGEWTAPRASPALGANQPLDNRVAKYLEDPKPYNAIFLGDSRTYCDIHPELLEPLVPGLHALNLSNFTNWFPTQLSLVRDIVAHIPPRTIVVWSIGHQNFHYSGSSLISVQRVYPIWPLDALRLTWWNSGHMPSGLIDNLSYYQPPLHAFVAAGELRSAVDRVLKRPLFPSTAAMRVASNGITSITADSSSVAGSSLTADVRAIEQQALTDPSVTLATVTTDQGRITSVIRYYRRGGYYRTEIDPSYFRTMQAGMGFRQISDGEAEEFTPAPPRGMEWHAFLAMLDLFAKHRVQVVVNEVEEAGFVYGHPLMRTKWRAMMRNVVQPEVERRGFAYVRTNLDVLSDDDYFDSNHMNSKGIAKYTPMLAQRLNVLMANR